MKELTYRLYGLIFLMMKRFPLRKKKVLLYMVHNSNFKDNLKFIYEEMKRRDNSFRFIVISKKELFESKSKNKLLRVIKKITGTLRFYFGVNYHFATSAYICLNDNFLPLAFMKLKKDTRLVQLWHGVGAFKKFGLSTERNALVRRLVSEGNKELDYLFVSSKQNIPFYQQAMGIDKAHIYATGVPVTDYYYQEANVSEARERVYQKYPMLQNKKTILYVPTFRNTVGENDAILKRFDTERLTRELGEDYVLMIRLHPQIKPMNTDMAKACVNVTEYEDVKELYMVSNLLISDYSSAVVEYALLSKPILFYAYDLQEYDRGFYDSYEEMVPGPIAKNMDDLLLIIKKAEEAYAQYEERRLKFLLRHHDFFDGQSTKRVVDTILKS